MLLAHTAQTTIDLGPVLVALVNVLVPALLAWLGYELKQSRALSADTAARDGIMAIAADGAHYAQNFANKSFTSVGNIDVGDPYVAATANYILKSATDEIAHLNLSDEDVIRLATAASAKVQNAISPIFKLTSTTQETKAS